MSKLKAITSKAKILYKSGKYAKWTDAIKAASKSISGTRIVKKSYSKKLGALPIDFKGNFLGYRFKILNQYQIDGGVTAQIVELDPPGDIIAQLSGNNKENDRVTNSLYASALATGKDIYLDKQDKSDLKKRINTFVIGLNKEVAAYNSGKDTTKKKSKGISLTYKPELKKLATVDKIKTILKEDKKILKGGYILKPGRIREKINGTGSHKDTRSHNVNIRVVSGIEKSIGKMERLYMAVYETKSNIVSDAIFKATSLQEAKKIANFHKRNTPEINKHRNVKTSVKLYKQA